MRKIFLSLLLFFSACAKPPAPLPIPTQTVDLAAVGEIRGTVSWDGVAPEPRKIPVASFPECQNPSGQDRDVLIQNGKVQNAFVAITQGLENYIFEVPSMDVVIDQTHCLYEPRVVGVQVNQSLVIKNSDPVLHNVRAQPLHGSKGFNVGMTQNTPDIRKRFDTPEVMLPLRCDVHPWMRAYVGVLPHPHFAVTGEDGAFSLPNVPAGTYTLTVWHERLGTKTIQVSVKEKEETKLDVKFEKTPSP